MIAFIGSFSSKAPLLQGGASIIYKLPIIIYHVAQIFFSLYFLSLGYLVYKSGFLPRFLGVFLMLGGFAYLINFFIFLLLPSYEGIILSVLEVFGLSEITFGVWLVVKGVRVERE